MQRGNSGVHDGLTTEAWNPKGKKKGKKRAKQKTKTWTRRRPSHGRRGPPMDDGWTSHRRPSPAVPKLGAGAWGDLAFYWYRPCRPVIDWDRPAGLFNGSPAPFVRCGFPSFQNVRPRPNIKPDWWWWRSDSSTVYRESNENPLFSP